MTNVIELAKQAGFDDKAGWGCDFGCNLSNLERFAKLVGNAKLEEAAHLCDELTAPSEISRTEKTFYEIATLDCAEAIRNLKEPTP